MENQLSETEKIQIDAYGDRRRLEMKRRFVMLQTRRSQLERELQTIKTLLVSLDKQMNHQSSYRKLSMNN